MIGAGPTPTDQSLYEKVKARVKKHFQKTSRWPSAYGSAHLVREYKKEFKKKHGNKNPYKEKRSITKKKKSVKKSKKKSVRKSKKKIDCRTLADRNKASCKKKRMSGGKLDCRTKRDRSKAGCKKSIKKNIPKKKSLVKKKRESGLKRWFNEKWVNVCKKKSNGSYADCGRKKSELKNYPYCRPLHRINSGTPMTVGEMVKKYGKKKIEQMCNKKNNKKNVKSNTYM